MKVEAAATPAAPAIEAPRGRPQWPHLVGGPLSFLVMLLIPGGVMAFPVKCAIGLLIWMAWWWLARPVDLAVTGFLPLVVVAALDFTPISGVLEAYASELIILLIGANILTTVWSRWGLDRRIGLVSALLIGTSPRRQVLAWLVISVALTAVLPNTIVAAILIPIVIAMLREVGIEDPWTSSVGTALVLAIAWGVNVGGFATPLGGAMNLLAMGFVEETVTQREFYFTTWATRMLPLTIATLFAAAVFLMTAFEIPKGTVWEHSALREELRSLGPTTGGEKWGLWLFGFAAVLAFARPLYASILPGLRPAYVFLGFGILCFAVRQDGQALVKWRYAQERMMWGLFYLFAGGFALGTILNQTGAARYVADLLIPYAQGGGFLAAAIFAVIAMIMTQITSHVAAVAILVPITISTFQSIGINPMPFVYMVAAIGNCGFVMPSSSASTAIAAGYGVDLRVMMVKGTLLAIITMMVILGLGYIMTIAWPGFGVA